MPYPIVHENFWDCQTLPLPPKKIKNKMYCILFIFSHVSLKNLCSLLKGFIKKYLTYFVEKWPPPPLPALVNNELQLIWQAHVLCIPKQESHNIIVVPHNLSRFIVASEENVHVQYTIFFIYKDISLHTFQHFVSLIPSAYVTKGLATWYLWREFA